MKKFIFSTAAFATLMLTACNNDSKTGGSNDTTTVEKKTETKSSNGGDSSATTTTTTITTTTDAPKFDDADVQKMADEYAAFINDYKTNMADPSKAAEYQKSAQAWAMKMAPAMQKLASKPEELKKWQDYLQKMAMQMQVK